jgi:hypothetical protein
MKQIRLLIAEYFLGFAFRIMPQGQEKNSLAELLVNYFKGNFVLKK